MICISNPCSTTVMAVSSWSGPPILLTILCLLGVQSDGERLPLAVKDLGSCDLYPQSLQHNPNGRFVTVCGDGEYIIYTALAWRNKSFGNALEFVWGNESNDFAIRYMCHLVSFVSHYRAPVMHTQVGQSPVCKLSSVGQPCCSH